MNNIAIKDSGIDNIRKAVESDLGDKKVEAFEYYFKGIEQLLVALKYEKNSTSRSIMRSKVNGYLVRAEYLKKEYVDKSKKEKKVGPPQPVAEDDDTSKLVKAVAATEVSNCAVRWDDVAGLEVVKDSLRESVVLPMKFPSLFSGKRQPSSAILLYGPPGTGKSFIAKAVATESGSKFYAVSSSDLISKWQGESEKLVKHLFATARANAPSVIFIDEIDALAGARSDGDNESSRRVKTEIMIQMQGMNNDNARLMVLGATNTPWTLDPAIRRRFEKRIYIPLPGTAARKTMFKLHLGGDGDNLTSRDFKELAAATEGYSGSDIAVLCKEALMGPVRECQNAKQFTVDHDGMYHPVTTYPNCPHCPVNLSTSPSTGKRCDRCGAITTTLESLPEGVHLYVPPVSRAHIDNALSKTPRTVAPSELCVFDEWTKNFGMDGSSNI
jgi:vacuolar protein-sorting-associated protein 4